jgi:2'-5' RNA ligase
MRMYALITPPPAVLDHLRQAVTAAGVQAPNAPWTTPAMWSCRLARFGNLGLHELTIVTETLGQIGTYCPPLALRLAGAEAHPSAASAEEISVGVEGDLDALLSLANTIPSIVQRHGLFLDRRSFRPVVTVAQATRQPFHAAAGLSALRDYVGPEWTATEMRLVALIPNSADEPGVGVYEDKASYAFSAELESDDDYVGARETR